MKLCEHIRQKKVIEIDQTVSKLKSKRTVRTTYIFKRTIILKITEGMIKEKGNK